MANSQSHWILPLLSLLHILSLFPSSAEDCVPPNSYYINCGSSSTAQLYGKNFTGDERAAVRFSGGRKVEDQSLSVNEVYKTARRFEKKSNYELNLDQDGTYMVRFHFYPFPSLENAQFSVSASGFSLLPDFRVGNNRSYPHIEEFLLRLPKGKFKIDFSPQQSSFAFVSAMEVILTPTDFIPDFAPHVNTQGPLGTFNGVQNTSLHVVHRINVGGDDITPDVDTMFRSWIADDGFLLNKVTARNRSTSGNPNYFIGGATSCDAPDSVYRTAKEMNINSNENSLNEFNITWRFDVRRRVEHFVRLHFSEIVLGTTNELFYFILYVYSNFEMNIRPYDYSSQNAAPFYVDLVVYSDDSGFLRISVGPNGTSEAKTAFLNGVEIMEVIRGEGLGEKGGGGLTRKHLLIIAGSCVGGAVVLLVILIVFVVCLRKKKWKHIEVFDWPLGPLNGGSSHSRTTVKTSVGSTYAELNLGLKVPFSEISLTTKHFNPKLMIGEGGFGKVYKGVLRNGTKVAVKRSEPGHGQGLPEFHTEIMVLSKIRHHHLVSLIGYCDERNEMILVYEFMENGTLRDHLYNAEGKKTGSRFSWEKRLEICIGAAKGIYYLHTGSAGAIIHRDIKSTNILLDENYVAKVADFGLSRSGLVDQTHVSTEVKGSFGYLDPEYFRCLQLTQKSDVYSFGVVLLEVLCARPVIDHTLPRDEVNLADWALSWLRKGDLERTVDPFLDGKINPNSLRKFGETVEKCLQEFGADRPKMVDVLWDLEYCLQLQQSAIPKQPYEDSTTEVSWVVPMNVVQRLPSDSMNAIEEDEHMSISDASVVFSLLNNDEPR